MQGPDVRTLSVLLQHEESQRDAAARALRLAEDQLTQGRAQSVALEAYRRETLERWAARMATPTTIAIVHSYRSFLQRLDQAVQQQAGALRRAEAAAVHRRDALLAAETRVAAVGRLIGRRQLEFQRNEHRREQRSTDEAAQRAHWSGAAAGNPDPFQ